MKDNNKLLKKFWMFLPIFFLFLLFRNEVMIVLSILIPVLLMLHKRFIGIVLGIDFCVVFGILSTNKFGPKVGAIVGGISFLFGMLLSLEVSKSPITTFYGTGFYAALGFMAVIIPKNMIFNHTLLILIMVNVLFFIGLKLLGAPVQFLMKYTFSNFLGNLIFIRLFEPLLKIMF